MYDKYIKIENGVLGMKQINSNDKLLYGLLLVLGRKNEKITAKNEFLGETLGLSVDAIKRSVKALKDNGLIDVENPNRYRTITIIEREKTKSDLKSEKLSPVVEEKLERLWYSLFQK